MFGLSWLSPTLVGGALLALLAAFGGGWATHKWDGIALSHAQADTAKIQGQYSDYKARVAADAAKANADALAQKTAQEASNAALEAKLTETQRNADAASNRLKAILDKAPPQDARSLGPSARAYFNSLRISQATGTGSTPHN